MTWCILKAHTENHGGTVKLRTKDPLDPPAINFHYFQEGTDKDGDTNIDNNKGQTNANPAQVTADAALADMHNGSVEGEDPAAAAPGNSSRRAPTAAATLAAARAVRQHQQQRTSNNIDIKTTATLAL